MYHNVLLTSKIGHLKSLEDGLLTSIMALWAVLTEEFRSHYCMVLAVFVTLHLLIKA